jgi:hypothetical protein
MGWLGLELPVGAVDGFSDSWVDGDRDSIKDGTADATSLGLGDSSEDGFEDGFMGLMIWRSCLGRNRWSSMTVQ